LKRDLRELVEMSKIKRILDRLYEMTGIAATVVDDNQEVLVSVGWHDLCMKYHRANPTTEQRCRKNARLLAERPFEGSYIGQKCLNGLYDYACPITVEGDQIATLLFGQVFQEPPDEDFFRQQAREFDFEEEAYLNALREIPIVEEEKIP